MGFWFMRWIVRTVPVLGTLLIAIWALGPAHTLAQAQTPTSAEPSVSFHASRGDARTGQPVEISLSVGNVDPSLDMKVTVAIKAPTGLSLNGASCASPGLCTAIHDLTSGQHSTMQLTAIANEAGRFVLVADVTWRSGGGDPSSLSRFLELNIEDAAEGETDVIVHADRTEVELGEPVRLTLTAANSIAKPPMTLKLTLGTPSGWSLSGSGFAESCAGQCIATYDVDKGEQRNIDLELVPNEAGSVEVVARLEWYFGGDVSTLERKADSLSLNAIAPLVPTSVPAARPVVHEVNDILGRPDTLGVLGVCIVVAVLAFATTVFLRGQMRWFGFGPSITIYILTIVIYILGASFVWGIAAGQIANRLEPVLFYSAFYWLLAFGVIYNLRD